MSFLKLRSLLHKIKKHQIGIFIILFIGTFIIGYWGYYLAFSSQLISASPQDLTYHTLQLFKLMVSTKVTVNNLQLEFARFFAPLLAFYAIISIIFIICYDQFTRFRLLFWNQHVIICGLGYLGPVIARNYIEQGKNVVIIEANQLNTEIETCRDMGAIVITGDATQEGLLEKANISRASNIFAVTGNDVKNLEIAIKSQSCFHREGDLVCHIHLTDTALCSVLKSHQLRLQGRSKFKLEFFNIYSIAGYCLQQAFPPFQEGSGSAPDTHILVFGAGKMGKTLIVRTAKKWRNLYGKTGKKLVVSIVDRHADNIKALLETQYPSIAVYCEIIPYPIEFMSQEFIRGSFLAGNEKILSPTSVYITLEDTAMGLSLALKLQERIHDPEVPIIVQSINIDGFTKMLDELRVNSGNLQNIHPFQIVSCACCKDLILNGYRGLIARAIHNTYLAKKRESGGVDENDPANREWNELNEELKASNYDQADFMYSQLYSIGLDIVPAYSWNESLFLFSESELEYLAEREHERWMHERIQNGWRYGSPRNVSQKISPYLIPYPLLDDEIKDYDRNTVRAIPSILEKLDLKIIRGTDGCSGR